MLSLLAASVVAACTANTPAPTRAAFQSSLPTANVGAPAQPTDSTDAATVQVLNVKRPLAVKYTPAPAGRQWVGVTVRVCLLKEPGYLSWQPWTLVDTDGARYAPSFVVDSQVTDPLYPDSAGAVFHPGECAQGLVTFQAPPSATLVRYSPAGSLTALEWR